MRSGWAVSALLAERVGRDDQHHERDDHRQLVELADALQRPLDPAQPGELALLEHEVEEEHEQEHPAEGRDGRVGLVQQVAVGARLCRGRPSPAPGAPPRPATSFAVMPTISSGKTSRMPNTAMATPTVRKIFCQNGLIRTSTVALTTALSKDSETSRTARIAASASPVPPP